MTAPNHISTTDTANTSNISSHTFNLPATVDAGDMLIALITMNYHVATPGASLAGWTLLTSQKLHDYHVTHLYAKIAAGTEDGGTLTFTSATPCRSSSQILRIASAWPSVANNVGIAWVAGPRVHGLTVDPPAITAPWGPADNLFVAVDMLGPWRASFTYPAGYSTNQSTPSSGARHMTASASKTVTATASDNPGTFSTSIATLQQPLVLVVRPADAGVNAVLTPSGGLAVAGSADATFTSGPSAGPVLSDLTVLWDLDNNGRFDRPEEDISDRVQSIDIVTGRDYGSALTGRANRGQVQILCRNDDDWLTPTNLDSPLNQAPLRLLTGRKLRVRTSDAVDPEPGLLLSDRFGESGDLAATEQAEPWAPIEGGNVTVADGGASPDDAGETIYVSDVRASDGYLQTRWRHCDASNGIGIVYRFVNDQNYGLVRVQGGEITHSVVASGVATDHGSEAIEVRPHMTFGVQVSGTDVTVWLEGVPLFTDAGDAASSGTSIGPWWDWDTHRSPICEEIYCWDGVWTSSPGVLFTGDATAPFPTIAPGPNKSVVITAEGWLARLARADVTPPVSIGVTTDSPSGVTAGLMVGQAMASANMLHPPPPNGLDPGQTVMGGVGTGNAKALYIARLFEAFELGLLFEHPEGPVGFEDSDGRLARSVVAALSDTGTGQIEVEAIEIMALGPEVFNQATAEVSPSTPVLKLVLSTTGNHASGAVAAITVTLPSGAQAAVGDLDLLCVVPACQLANESIEAPTGWTPLGSRQGPGRNRELWFARKLTSGDLSSSVTFYTAGGTGGGGWLVRQFIVEDWYGAVESGVAISEPSGATGATAQAGTIGQPTILIPWGRQPCLIIATKSGMTTSGSPSVSMTNPDNAPNGYGGLDADHVAATVSTADVGNAYAWKHASVGVESPSGFGGTFTGFNLLEATTVAVRGYTGDPPEQSTGERVTVDDLQSQAEHNTVSAYPDVAQFHASVTAANAWCDSVLAAYGSDRPLLRIAFTASQSSLHRWLALTLRVSDLVRVNATGRSGLGVNALYHVEQIHHSVSPGLEGDTLWLVELVVSPAE